MTAATTRSRATRIAGIGAALSLSVTLAACGGMGSGSEQSAPQAPASSAPAAQSSAPSGGTSSSMPSSSSSASSSGAMAEPFGPGCASVPKDGAGSFDGMSKDPVATAAGNNPALSTLVTAVGQAGLGDTLNSAKDITVFAPTNDAFAKMDKATMDKAMGDPKGLLTDVLTAHVVPGRLAPDQLAGEHETLNKGQKVMVSGQGEQFKVNNQASVVCGNVQTANATVYIIDSVLLPAS